MLPRPLRNAAALLRAACPTRLPVRIRLVDLDDAWGDCSKGARTFTIRLHRPLALAAPGLMVYVLLHEWAEALAWGESTNHGDEFGRAYAKCCRVYAVE